MIIDYRQAAWVDQHTGKGETIILFLDSSEFLLQSFTTLSIGFWNIIIFAITIIEVGGCLIF